ncbi:uncharacterized protein KIAA0895 homolog [Rhinatrema bivittatum]|uniref:uncharacterized protein KIAA0895 homolog n=1 Tax=Rhinatrema bivittatum TaxID=194408 RepID=UPI00112E096C|nr:uncharacterized protein KIAA0895 homolog [Rhinatrema bivittatum]
MLESIRATEKLHWPKVELSKKSVLSPEYELTLETDGNDGNIRLTSGVLKDTFTTGTNSYNVLLQSREMKKLHHQRRPLSALHKRHRKAGKSSSSTWTNEHLKIKASLPLLTTGWCQSTIQLPDFASSDLKFTHSFTIAENNGLSPKPVLLPKDQEKESESSGRKNCILTAIKPSNIEKEKIRFFKSEFTYNPQFEYANPALPDMLAKHSNASDRFLQQAINIMMRVLKKYGSYEKFEQANGGSLLPKSRIWTQIRKYMEREHCLGEIVVNLTEDLLSRASMTIVNGRPTLTINISTAREQWLEGMLRHEIGTHYFRGMNNNQQPWCKISGRKKLGLKPVNPTEEGLASIHSVLFRKDPFLWRAALLYYTVYQASCMSFSELFQDLGRFVKDPNTRWDYCVRAKRGWTDTSIPGCFGKDQVYLDGILQILRHRETINFQLLTVLGKVSYEDVDRLKKFAITENIRIPHFLQNQSQYKEQLEKIMEVNELTDKELQELIL